MMKHAACAIFEASHGPYISPVYQHPAMSLFFVLLASRSRYGWSIQPTISFDKISSTYLVRSRFARNRIRIPTKSQRRNETIPCICLVNNTTRCLSLKIRWPLGLRIHRRDLLSVKAKKNGGSKPQDQGSPCWVEWSCELHSSAAQLLGYD